MKCKTCYFWSEMVAQSIGGGPIEALCLNDNSDFHQKMMAETNSCPDWEDGSGGAIDCPIWRE